MGKPQYTPGSWRADITPHGVSIRAGAPGTRDAANSIAWLGDSNLRPSAENEANAHLMAAAPALLEALESIAMCNGCSGDTTDCNCPVCVAQQALAAARPDSPTPNTETTL